MAETIRSGLARGIRGGRSLPAAKAGKVSYLMPDTARCITGQPIRNGLWSPVGGAPEQHPA